MKYILLILGLAFILWEPLRAFFSKRSKREKWDQDKKLAVLLVCNWFFLLGLIPSSRVDSRPCSVSLYWKTSSTNF